MHRRLALMVFGLVLLALAAQPAAAQFNKSKAVKKHLEKKHDYKVEKGDDVLVAKHVDWLNIRIKELSGGLYFYGYYETSAYDRDELIELCNDLNRKKAVGTRLYVDDEEDIIIEGWYPGEYDKDSFEAFMQMWHTDMGNHWQEIKSELDI